MRGVECFPREILIPSNTNRLRQIIETLTPENLLAQNCSKITQMPYLLAKNFKTCISSQKHITPLKKSKLLCIDNY